MHQRQFITLATIITSFIFSTNIPPSQTATKSQVASTPTGIVTTPPSITTTSTPVPPISTPSQSSDELLQVYDRVLDTSVRTVEEVHKTTNLLVTIIGLLFTVLTAAGIGAWWQAGTARREVDSLAIKADAAKKTVDQVAEAQRELERNAAHTSEAMGRNQRGLADISKNLPVLKRSLTLLEVDTYAMGLFSEDHDRFMKSVGGLLALSGRQEDAVIRRHAAKALGALETYDSRVAEKLEELASNDPEPGVRKTAQASLRKIRAFKSQATEK